VLVETVAIFIPQISFPKTVQQICPSFVHASFHAIITHFFWSWKISHINIVWLYWMYHSSKCYFSTSDIQNPGSWPAMFLE